MNSNNQEKTDETIRELYYGILTHNCLGDPNDEDFFRGFPQNQKMVGLVDLLTYRYTQLPPPFVHQWHLYGRAYNIGFQRSLVSGYTYNVARSICEKAIQELLSQESVGSGILDGAVLCNVDWIPIANQNILMYEYFPPGKELMVRTFQLGGLQTQYLWVLEYFAVSRYEARRRNLPPGDAAKLGLFAIIDLLALACGVIHCDKKGKWPKDRITPGRMGFEWNKVVHF